MMVDMGLDNIVHNDRDICHARIFNTWINDWYSDILITRDWENEQHILQKYNHISFIDDDYNQTYIIKDVLQSVKLSLPHKPRVLS